MNNVLVHTETGINFSFFGSFSIMYTQIVHAVSVSLAGGSGYTRVDYDDFHFSAVIIP